MTIILDENLPRALNRIFPGHSVTTVQEQGLAGTVNGALLAQWEGAFEVARLGSEFRVYAARTA